MADPALNIPRISAKEYLEIDRESMPRHEFIDGIVYAMAGASKVHNFIAGDAYASLLAKVAPPCQVFLIEVKVQVETNSTERYFYPDVLVTCSDLDSDTYISKQPTLIIEVVSKTTEGLDRNEKFVAYRLLPSFQEYVLVLQDQPQVEVFRKRTGWVQEKYGLGDEILLESIGQTIPVATFYRRVSF